MEAAFFDLDKTVIARAALVAFSGPLHRAGYLSRWLVLRALYGHFVFQYFGADDERMARMRESALRVTRGWHQPTIKALVEETLDEVIDPIVYAEALELIRMHKEAGRRVKLIEVAGHADERGNVDTNVALTGERAPVDLRVNGAKATVELGWIAASETFGDGQFYRFQTETFELNLRESLAAAPEIPGYAMRLIDPHTIEVDVDKEQGVNAMFAALGARGVEVTSMRNKVNRLEELFVRMVERDDA